MASTTTKCEICGKLSKNRIVSCQECDIPDYCSKNCRDKDKRHYQLCIPAAKFLPREEDMYPYTGPGEDLFIQQREITEKHIHDIIVQRYGNIPHCTVCGEIEKNRKLKKALGKILCDDCINIKITMC